MREPVAHRPGCQSGLRQLAAARAKTDALFRIIDRQALFDRPIRERHRLIFYVGHLEAFDWNLIWKGAFEREPFHEGYDRLFAFGIDPVDGKLPSDQSHDWPSSGEVRDYCGRVRRVLDGCLNEYERTGSGPRRYEEELASGTLTQVAVEHRLMHAETLAYMLHQLPASRKFPQPQAAIPKAGRVVPQMIEIPAGRATLGQKKGGRFGWDNEFEAHVVDVPAFRIDAHKVTNGQFLSTFPLHSSNDDPEGVVSDGARFWVVDEEDRRMYEYDLTGAFIRTLLLNHENKDAEGLEFFYGVIGIAL